MLKEIKVIVGCTILTGVVAPIQAQDREPNFVLYLTEDLSPHYLAMYNDGKGAKTPTLRLWLMEA